MIWPRTAAGALAITEDTTGAAWIRGFLRRPADGALIVSPTLPGVRQHDGFSINSAGAICYTADGAVSLVHGGFARGSQAELVTATVDPAPAYLHHGLKFDSSGRVFAGPGELVLDTMTGADATSLAAHVGEVGAAWVLHPTATSTMQLFQGRLRGNLSTAYYVASASPASPNYEVSTDVVVITDNNSSAVGVTARHDPVADTKYLVRYTSSNDQWEMSRTLAGASTSLGLTAAFPIASGTHRLTLRCLNDQITALLDGVAIFGPVTDANIAAGRPGIYSGGTGGDAVGFHLDNYRAVALL